MDQYLVDHLVFEGCHFTSSNIDILGYDREAETLYVEFLSGNTVYSYSGVKESTFDMLVSAESVGSFYVHHIKDGNYSGAVAGTGVIRPRSEAETEPADDPIQPETKWLSVPEGEKPDFVKDDERYVVEWTSPAFPAAGPFRPEFRAVSEAAAIAAFQLQMQMTFGNTVKAEVKSVTHYFD